MLQLWSLQRAGCARITPAYVARRHTAAVMADPDTRRPQPPPLDPAMALFLDVDGVLLEFAAAPDAVRVAPGLVDRLQALHRQLGGALALVSGRAIADLDQVFAPARLPCAGLHGLQRRHGTTESIDVPVARGNGRILAALIDAACRVARHHPGVIAEDKGAALALHWRQAPEAASELLELAQTALRQLPDYRLQRGNCVVELRPDFADKGNAIAAFLQESPFAGRLPVFLGDDLTDEDGFALVNSRRGASVLVGTREPSAACNGLADVAAVHAWLGVQTRRTDDANANANA